MGRLYQEEGSTFSHQGKEYDLNTLFRLTQDRKPVKLELSKLTWILEYGEPDEDRVKAADTSVPILVVHSGNTYYEIDGFHRLTKAKREGLKTIPVILITDAELATAEIKPNRRRAGPTMDHVKELELKKRMIAMEAMNLNVNIDSIKAKLTGIAGTLTSFVQDRVRPQAAIGLISYSQTLGGLEKVRYTDLYQIPLAIPRGLKVTMPQYVEGLTPMVVFAESLMNEVLIPFSTWLSLRIAAPESLATASTVTQLKGFADHDIELYRSNLGKYLDPASRVEKLPLGKLYPNLASIQPTWDGLNALTTRYIATRPAKVVSVVNEIAVKINRLIDILEGKDRDFPDVKVSSQTITILSSLCWKMAEEVDFYGVLGTLIREVTTACNLQSLALKGPIKDHARANQKAGIILESFEPTQAGFTFNGQWVTEEVLYWKAEDKVDHDEPVNIEDVAWVLEHTHTPAMPEEEFDPMSYVTCVRFGDKLYPLMGLEYLATMKAGGAEAISVAVLDPEDLVEDGLL